MEKIRRDGRNLKLIRDLFGMTQEVPADALGITQQAYSKIEQKDEVDDETMKILSEVFKVPVEAIRNFDPAAAISYINTFNDASINHGANFNYQCDINPIDKWMESLKKNEELYERLLKTEREKVALMEKLLNDKK
jgi:transcriptional regulator with XRE-family HTH domain